ncbi:hypothetical protein E2C01_049574 [Portunus trituberculatus]|uniref:Uncharacterized protein n=1 Tax=Portunus trituberculatus TaxID=210409 RepID=A0A5B7G5Y8_PORTR|nr:hypothetical protein [Portunus trituberculatus]
MASSFSSSRVTSTAAPPLPPRHHMQPGDGKLAATFQPPMPSLPQPSQPLQQHSCPTIHTFASPPKD